jgi:lysophospholipase L1-like esterase
VQAFDRNNQQRSKQTRHASLSWVCDRHAAHKAILVRLLLLVLLCGAFVLSGCASSSSSPTRNTQSKKQAAAFTYVAIGASDTFGVGANDPYTENWPSDLTELIGGRVHLLNLGVPSMTVHNALDTELPIVLTTQPNLVTIWLAVNDLATHVPVDNYSHDLDTLLSRLQAVAPHARIEVGNVPDLTSVPFFFTYDQNTLRQEMSAYNRAIASIVKRHHTILVDLSGQSYNLQEFPQYISGDGLHPSTSGYLQIAQLFYQSLQHP